VRRLAAGALALGLAAAASARADSLHLYSYDPADTDTVHASGPLTFTLKRGVLHTTVLNLRSTISPATAYLRPADARALGRDGLAGVNGIDRPERNLYEVRDEAEGEALISAFCPGAGRAWMAFGPMKLNRDLEVAVIGAPKSGGAARLCRTLRFNFHGEWLLPPGRVIDERDLPHGRYPGT
jgi:hypothetical protein